jgi:NAD(P)-dependent dehydrogenase (short-subunit alcohol dehydrogenase family)/acyl carrier protein
LAWEFSESSQYAGFYSLLFLAQAVGKVNLTEKIEITVLSNHLQAVSGEERMSPEKATVLGPCRVIPQEYGNLSCRNVDVVVAKAGTWQRKRLVERLLAELRGEGKEWLVAYRGPQRWVKSFEPVRLERTEGRPRCLREEGVYLITGGLGGVGLELAEYLARSVRARLVLIGRSEFPAEETWEPWLAEHAGEDPVSVKIRKLQTIAGLGAQLLILRADVSDHEQMQQALQTAERHFGPIHGIIHAAGIAGFAAAYSIQELTPTHCEEQFRAKIHGVIVIEQILEGKQLDFCMLISSLSTILGGLGFCAYAAANMFMDAFAQERYPKHPLVWSSVDWNGWEFRTGVDPAMELTMTPNEGIEAFSRLLEMDSTAHTIVSVASLTGRLSPRPRGRLPAEDRDRQEGEGVNAQDGRPTLTTSYVAPSDEIEELLVDVWQRLLGIDRIGACDDFFELGGHSLLAVQLVTRLREIFRVEIPLRLIFEFSSIQPLARALGSFDSAATERITKHLKRIKTMSNEEKRATIREKRTRDLVASP